jgi:hypothetical protein
MYQLGCCYGYGALDQPQRNLGTQDYGRSVIIGDETWQVLMEHRVTKRGKEPGALFNHRIGYPDGPLEQIWVPFSAMNTVECVFGEGSI